MDNTYHHIAVQIENLSRMINNLSNRLSLVETTTNNNNQTSLNNTNLFSNTEQELLQSLNPTFTHSNPTNLNYFRTRPAPYNPPVLRRPPIRPESRQPNTEYHNPLWSDLRMNINPETIPRTNNSTTNTNNNNTNTPIFNNRHNRTPSNGPSRRRLLPTLNNPEIRRSYNPDGSVDSVEMTFTNLVSQEELNSMVQNAANPTTQPLNLRTNPRLSQQIPTRRGINNRQVINSPEDARMFLSLLNALSTTPPLANDNRRLTLRDINNHTTISTYHQPEVNPEEETDATQNEEICLICRAPFEEGDVLRRLNNCPHYFHCNCIDSWFELRNTCPVCRHIVTENTDNSSLIENNSNNSNNSNTSNTNNTDEFLINIDSNETNNSLQTVDRLD